MSPGDQEPNLFEFPRKHIWREVFHGHWKELNKGDKLAFAGEVTLLGILVGSVTLIGIERGNFFGAVAAVLAFVGIYGLIFGGAALLMTRSIRKRPKTGRYRRKLDS
jgi:hypothetical protein